MIVTLFQGCDGWGEGLRMLGLHDQAVGIEHDRWATLTARAAGHHPIRADVETYPTRQFADVDGIIASPPCPTFSSAGSGCGRTAMDELLAALVGATQGRPFGAHRRRVARVMRADRLRTTKTTKAQASAAAWRDARMSFLSIAPVRWIVDTSPEWVAMEQVPTVMPLWEAYRRWLRQIGYSAWCGVLLAADYGVPQTRRRAILIASRTRTVTAPEPTHSRPSAQSSLWPTRPWVTMADALGWDGELATGANTMKHSRDPAHVVRYTRSTDRPSPVVDTKVGSAWRLNPGRTATQPRRRAYEAHESAPTVAFGHDAASWCWERPATTVVGSFRPDVIAAPGYRGAGDGPRQKAHGSVSVSVSEALVLQSFRPDYPVQGPKSAQFLQVGNAVPPLLAAHVLAAATGRRLAPSTLDLSCGA